MMIGRSPVKVAVHRITVHSERRSIWLLSRAHPLFANTRRAAPSLHSGIAVGGVSGLYYFALY